MEWASGQNAHPLQMSNSDSSIYSIVTYTSAYKKIKHIYRDYLWHRYLILAQTFWTQILLRKIAATVKKRKNYNDEAKKREIAKKIIKSESFVTCFT